MAAIDNFYEDIQENLNVDASWLTTKIPRGVTRAVKRLLRDYHFPKADRTQIWDGLIAGQQQYTLPDDFGLERILVFMDDTNAAAPLFSDPLRKRDAFVRPGSDLIPRFYWMEGTTLWTDIVVPSEDAANTNLVMIYRSNDYDYNLEWMLEEIPDVLLSLSMFRLCAEFNKTELLPGWSALWKEDKRSLALFANEQEYHNMDIVMKEVDRTRRDNRYPGGS